jgi:hypothetical protein
MLVSLLLAQDPSVADRAAVAALQRVSGLPQVVVTRRIPAEAQWDLVVAMAGQRPAAAPGNWSTRERLGVLLQDRTDPAKVDVLAAQPGPNDDCFARIVHITAEELVVSCTGEKDAYGNQNFVYDIRSRKLVSHFSYSPFWTARVLPGKNGPQFVMADYHRLLLVDIDPTGTPRVTPAAEARPVLAQVPMEENIMGDQTLHVPAQPPDPFAAFGPGRRFHFAMEKNNYGSEYPVLSEGQGAARKVYPLAQTDLDTWQRARPDDAKTYLHLDQAEMNEQIGPHQVEGGRLWFGKTFYNGEGATGLGGFGYFDTATASYHLIAPPEIYAWSVSAILVEPECIWLALYHRGEYGNYPGGLLRWDRKAATVRQFAVKTVVTGMVESGGTLYLGATDGIVTVKGELVASFFVDARADGTHQVVKR